MHRFRKYPNRRIYDLEASKYVTLDAVLGVILSGRSVKIEMAETEEDVTQATLLQVLAEQEKANSTPLLTNIALEQLIRFTGNPYSQSASKFIEKSLEFMSRQQESLREAIAASSLDPFSSFENTMKFWTGKF
jgi:polyhydroxyalkanoate synthesis repressor PhaR